MIMRRVLFLCMLRAESLTKSYRSGGRELMVLHGITFALEPASFLAIVGPSGSGKSTLLALLAGLDRPTRGRVFLDGTELAPLSEDERARFAPRQGRLRLPVLPSDPDPDRPGERAGAPRAARRGAPRARRALLGRVGLEGREHHYPAQLSGGEQQRVALARAFSHRPRLLFADEPTGNLDAATGARVVELMGELNEEHGTTLVLVTHDAELAGRARRVLRLRDGAMVEDADQPQASAAGARGGR